jgi:hypothetical protein
MSVSAREMKIADLQQRLAHRQVKTVIDRLEGDTRPLYPSLRAHMTYGLSSIQERNMMRNVRVIDQWLAYEITDEELYELIEVEE